MDKNVILKWKMPERPECFFGREQELKKIEELFAHGNQVIFIQGIGGIGKSALAAQYAISYRANYDVIVFANCVSDIRSMVASDVEMPMENFVRNTLDEYYLETEDAYFQRKMESLKVGMIGRTLLVVDNLTDMEDKDLDEFLALPCEKIITTRCDCSSKMYPTMQLQEIKNERELEKIFTHYYIPKNDMELAKIRQLIAKLGGHTLSVEWIARQLTEQAITIDQMLRELEGINLSQEGIGGDKERLFQMIRGVFQVKALGEQEKEVLRLLCFVPITGISKEDIVRWGRKGTHTAVLKLLRSSWLKQAELDMVALHPIVAETVKMELRPDWENMSMFVKGLISDLLDEEIPVKQIGDMLTIAENMFRVMGTEEAGAVDLLEAVGIVYLKRYHQYETAIEKLNLALRLQSKRLETIRVKLAMCKEANSLDAEYNSLKEELLVHITQQGRILHQIGEIYFVSGQYDKALATYMKLNDNPVVDVYCDIAKVYAKVNEYRKAMEYVMAGIKIKKRKYGKNEIPLVESYLLLASIASQSGDYRLALQWMEQAKQIAENQMNEKQQSDFYYEYAILLKNMGKVDEALQYDQKTYILRKKIYGEEHLGVVRAYAAMAVDYYRLGDYVSALECSLREIKVRKRIRRTKRRLYFSVSRLIGYVNTDTLPEDMKEELKIFTSDFNRMIRENPQEGREMLRQ